MAIDSKLISRINELAKLKKEGKLTEEQAQEQATLRQEYLKQFKAGFKQQMESTTVVKELEISRLNVSKEALNKLNNDKRIKLIEKLDKTYKIGFDYQNITEKEIYQLISQDN